jgi:hypothetical protein
VCWLLAALAAGGCEASTGLILVNLRTDFAVPAEVVAARTVMVDADGAEQQRRLDLDPTADWLHGGPIAELRGLPLGPTSLRISLLAADEAVVLERPVAVDLDERAQAVTVGMGRSCVDVVCEGDRRACVGRRCVPETCFDETSDEACGEPECRGAADCEAGLAGCARAACVEGACLSLADEALCAATERCDAQLGCVGEAFERFALDFAGFANASEEWTLNGAAGFEDDALVVGRDGEDPGSAFVREALSLDARADLDIDLTVEVASADGVVLVLQADPRADQALGGPGGGLGFGSPVPVDTVAPSLGVELDTFRNSYDDDGNHVAILQDGRVGDPLASAELPFSLVQAGPVRLRVAYRSATQRLQVFVFQGDAPPAEPTVEARVDLAPLAPRFYLGFTGTARVSNRVTRLAARSTYAPLE